MPTYEYICTKCKHEFEIVRSIADKPLIICPKELCRMKRWGKGKVKKKIVAGAGLIFKGSGFYSTDYRSDNYKAGAKEESSAGIAEKKALEGGTKDAKPAAAPKTESKTKKKE